MALGQYLTVQPVPLTQTLRPSTEIGDICYFSLEEYQLETHQVTGVLMAFKNSGWMDLSINVFVVSPIIVIFKRIYINNFYS